MRVQATQESVDWKKCATAYLEKDVFSASGSYFVDHVFYTTNELFIWASRYNSHSEGGECVLTSQTKKPHADTERAEETASGSLAWWE